MSFQDILAAVVFCLIFTFPICTAESDYTLQMYEYKNFGGEHVTWNGKFGQCGIQWAGFYVGSVVLPIGGVGCSIWTDTDWPCFGKATYKLKYTESDINPSTTDGTTYPNTWYSWKCWPCEYCGTPDARAGSEAEPSKNNSLTYASASKSENEEGELFVRLEYSKTAVDLERDEAHVEMSKRDTPNEHIEDDDPDNLNGAITRELLANDAISKTHNETIEASDEANAHLVRAAVPKFKLPHFHLSKSHKSSPKPKSKDKKCNNITGDCSDAASLVPMRKLLGVAVGAGVVAGAGL